MAIKVVLLFQQVSNNYTSSSNAPVSSPSIGYGVRTHLAGWSESLWWNANNFATLVNAMKNGYGGLPGLLPARAALLGYGAGIIGARFYQGGAGRGQSLAFSYPGGLGVETDQPQTAILVKAGPTGAAVTRRFTLRGIPDSNVAWGEFSADTAFSAAIANYFQAISNYSFYAIDPASPAAPIFNIDATGLVTLNAPTNPFVVNQFVTISKVIDAVGAFHTLTTTVKTIGPQANQFTLTAWPFGPCTAGKAVTKVRSLFQISAATCAVSRVVTRKVGRPFEQYRGRRSKRRKTA
jgi:hypothetical protein